MRLGSKHADRIVYCSFFRLRHRVCWLACYIASGVGLVGLGWDRFFDMAFCDGDVR